VSVDQDTLTRLFLILASTKTRKTLLKHERFKKMLEIQLGKLVEIVLKCQDMLIWG